MEPLGTAFGFGTPFLNEIRILIARYRNYCKNPVRVDEVREKFKSLEDHAKKIECTLDTEPDLISEHLEDHARSIMSRLGQLLAACKVLVHNELLTCEGGGSSSAPKKKMKKVKEFAQAKRTDGLLKDLESKLEEADEKYTALFQVLATSKSSKQGQKHSSTEHSNTCRVFLEGQEALKDELKDVLVALNPIESYRASTNAPKLPANIFLQFGTLDATGDNATPELDLKNNVLSATADRRVTAAMGSVSTVASSLETAARGSGSSVFGVVGMAGVGKTTALIGLAHDVDIKMRFVDGVWYCSFGVQATTKDVIHRLKDIMEASGATTSATKLLSQTSIFEAASKAARWFQGKTCLFIFDDLWPMSVGSTSGYLYDLQQILQGSPESRIAVGTRHRSIAITADAIVPFDVREPLGENSIRIFNSHAHRPESRCELSSAEKNILAICDGLPIALALSGSSVLEQHSFGLSYAEACNKYAEDLRYRINTTKLFTDESGNHNLFAAIMVSLMYLEEDLSRAKLVHPKYSVQRLYSSLCVMRNQQIIPVPVLSRMWGLDCASARRIAEKFCSVSLGKMSSLEDTSGLQLHDLHLAFCRLAAKEEKLEAAWHAQLLGGHISLETSSCKNESAGKQQDFTEAELLKFTPRNWWSTDVPNRVYIFENVMRHLFGANLLLELAALVLKPCWLDGQAKFGGMQALKQDFGFLARVLESSFGGEAECVHAAQLLIRAIETSPDFIADGPRTLSFLLLSSLREDRTENIFLEDVLQKIEAETPAPYLKPMSTFRSALRHVPTTETRIGGYGMCISLCGRFVAAGSKNDVSVLDASSLETLKRLSGHTGLVISVAFDATSTTLVSGSFDRRVMVWKWNSCNSSCTVLGHEREVGGVAVSNEGDRVFSASWDKSVRKWDMTSGKQMNILKFDKRVNSLRVCPKRPWIAIGLKGGVFKVYNYCTFEIVFEADTRLSIAPPQRVDFSPDGSQIIWVQEDGWLQLMSTETWTGPEAPFIKSDQNNRVTCVTFTADGRHVISGSMNGTIRLYSTVDGSGEGSSPAMGSPIFCLAYLQDGRRIASLSHDGVVRLWRSDFAPEIASTVIGHTEAVAGVAIVPDGSLVASCSYDGTVAVWSSANGSPLFPPIQIKDSLRCIAISPDGRTVVCGCGDGKLWLCDATNGAVICESAGKHEGDVNCMAYSRDGQRIISGGDDKEIRIWDSATLESTADPLVGHSEPVCFVSEAHDGISLVSQDWRYETIIWTKDTGAIYWRSIANESETEAKTIILSCGDDAPHLWQETFGEYFGELFCKDDWNIFAHIDGKNTVVGAMSSEIHSWAYSKQHSVFVAGLLSGAVAICKLRK